MKYIIQILSILVAINLSAQTTKLCTYTYDDLNRLTLVTLGDGTQIMYCYDELGNRTCLNASLNCPISTNLSVTASTETTATVSWENIGYPAGTVNDFEVQLRTDNSTWTTEGTAIMATTFDFTGLTEGVTYYFRIISNCVSGTPVESPSMSFTTSTIIPPSEIGDCSEDEYDTEAPLFLNCPTTTLVFGNDPDLCGAYVNFSIPVPVDNCPGVVVNYTSGAQPGDLLEVGMHSSTYTAVDTAGNTNTCTINIEIKDTQMPLLACPTSLILENDFGQCSRQVFGIAPALATDNCDFQVTWSAPGATPNNGTNDASGTNFPVGTTTITYTIEETNNPDGNQTATCSFDITVEDTELPTIDFCPSDIVVSNAPDACGAIVTYNTPTFNDNCDGNGLSGIFVEGLLSGSFFPVGTTTVIYNYTDAAGNGPVFCEFTVTVNDTQAPEIFCEQIQPCNTYMSNQSTELLSLDVMVSEINVPNDFVISEVNLLNIIGTHPSLENVKMELTSPTGTVVTIFDGNCTGAADFNFGSDDETAAVFTSGPCAPFDNGFSYQPVDGNLSDFDGESSTGIWTLTITNDFDGICGTLESWNLELCGNTETAQTVVLSLAADEDECSFAITETNFDPPFSDNCPDAYIRHDYITGPFDHTLQGAVFPVGITTVTWTVTDQAGNTSTCMLDIEVLDTEAPEFLNCPRPDIIENAETSLCGAYVNFSPPIAEDNCGIVTVTQTDNTGLNTGSIFPVGKTILEWTATDDAGNSTICTVNIIVNDTQAPSIVCPPDLTVENDPMMCGAVVNNIAPLGFSDNCTDNLSIAYQIEYPVGSGDFIKNGMTDASGFKFDVGTSRVIYRIADQPLLLISEVTQEIEALNGGTDPIPAFFNSITTDDYIEITNFGPSTIDVSCLNVERLGVAADEFLSIPAGTMMAPGEVLIVHFGNGTDDPSNLYFNANCAIDAASSQPVGYVISYAGVVIDVVTTNGFDPVGQSALAVISPADWTSPTANSSNHGSVYRTTVFDSNGGEDFAIADVCMPATLGTLNPDLEFAADNGETTALQTISPNEESCNFLVTVNDTEMPYCGEFEDHLYTNGTNLGVPNSIVGGSVFQSVMTVSESFTVGNVDIFNLLGQHTEMSDLTFKLKSPSGTQVILWNPLCAGTADFDVNLDSDSLVASVTTAPCAPLGQGGLFTPEESLKAFYGENSQGDWILEIADTVAANDGQLINWELRLSEIQDYSQMDTTIENELGFCSAEFTWIHPRLIDNCCAGTIEVEYIPVAPEMQAPQGGVVEGGTETTERFDVGITTVKYTLTDQAGNVNMCSFDVTVLDVEDPVVMCPNNIIVHLDPGACEIALSYQVTATDNCEVDTIIQIDNSGFTSGDYFPIGTTIQTWVAIDTSGNTDTCSFDITVFEYVPLTNDITCNSFVHLSLDATCDAEITADLILLGNNYGCFDDYIITVAEDTLGNIIPTSPIVTQSNIGDTLVVTILDPDTGNSCWGYLLVEDKVKPEFECPADLSIKCNESYLPIDTGEPVLLSCENSVTMVYEDNFVDNGNCGMPRAEIFRTWIVTDDSGNSDTCVQHIIIERFSIIDVLFPENLDNVSSDALECLAVANDPSMTDPNNTGFPTIDGHPITTGTLCPLSIEYNDNLYDVCEGSYDIVRTWEIYDPCEPSVYGVNPKFYNQTIKIVDGTAPIISCENFTAYVGSNSCEMNLILPPLNIEDACSAFSVIIEGPSGDTIHGNGGVFPGLFELGDYTFNYSAKDGCGNVSDCDVTISVVDNISPTPICIENTIASLDNNGVAIIDASTFDNESFDNCEIVLMEVRKMTDACNFAGNLSFGNEVSFCCEELGTIVMVEFRVTDGQGLMNSCMVEVEVQDKIDPIILCPPNITISCNDDIEDLSLTGEAIGTDNCGTVTISHNDISNTINDCGEGMVTRVWTATDGAGATVFCIQSIILENNNQFNITDTECRLAPLGASHSLNDNVEFPCDIELTTCGLGLLPEDLELNSSVDPLDVRPQLFGSMCENVGVTYQDHVLEFGAGDACLKILRTWIIIDWCQADANQDPTLPGPGVWHYSQLIKVINSTDPIISNLNGPSIVDNFEPNCGSVNVSFDITVSDDCTDQNDLIIDWEFSNGITGSGSSASGVFTNGNYSVEFTVSDGCGNEVSQSHTFEVVDAKKPTPSCLFGIATVIMPSSGEVMISASTFETGNSSDNCTAYDDLQISFSQDIANDSMVLSCVDFQTNNGLVPIIIYVTDEAGNFDFCSSFVQLQDPNFACPSPTNLIHGSIENENQEMIQEVTVGLSDNSGSIFNPIITGADGQYQFNMQYGNYDVTPEKDINYLNGVTTYDLVLISKHILGIELLNSPYKIIAADANHSETITALDILKLRSLILHHTNELANNESWRFVDKNYIFPNPQDPFQEVFPEYISLDGTNGAPANFVAVKIGDLNGTALPNNLLGSDTRNFDGKLILVAEGREVEKGESFTLDFRAKDFNDIEGYQFTLDFDETKLEFLDVKSQLIGLGIENFGLTKLEEGIITTSWNRERGVSLDDNSILFSLTFKAKTISNLDELFKINSRFTESEAYSKNKYLEVVLNFGKENLPFDFELYQNVPNPFKNGTSIGFTIPYSDFATISIFDISGKLIHQYELDADQGYNEIIIKKSDLGVKGVFYYQFKTTEFNATKKMILIE